MTNPRSARDVVPDCDHCQIHVERKGGRDYRLARVHCADCGITLWPDEAKPSPREALRAVVEELTSMRDGQQALANDALHVDRARYCVHKAEAYGEAITLIRSMAGHLMEPNE